MLFHRDYAALLTPQKNGNGRRLGTLKLAAIDTSLVDELYGKLLVVKEADDDGKVIEHERRTTVNHAMKSCRRAWNVADRRNPYR